MTTIKILGTGCPKCQQTTVIVESVVEEKNLEVEVVKVDDIMDIIEYNVMSTPAVVVDGEVKITGKVPTKAEVEALFN